MAVRSAGVVKRRWAALSGGAERVAGLLSAESSRNNIRALDKTGKLRRTR
ncbi:hypothetical protein [Actinoplanes auranticolor]